MLREGAAAGAGRELGAQQAPSAGVGTAQQQVAEADALDRAGGEVLEPGVDQRVPAVIARRDPAVAGPGPGVLGGVLPVALQHPGVDSVGEGGLEPCPRVREAVLLVGDLPVAEHDGARARGEVRGELGEQLGEQGVAGAAAVAVGPGVVLVVARAGRDHEGRVGDDEVEDLPGDGLEEGAAAQVELDPVQRGVEGGEGEGALGEVGGHDVLGVAGGVHRLDPAAAAEVEHSADGRARRDPGEGEGGAAHAEDVLGGERGAGRELGEVRGDPPVERAGIVLGGVGGQVHEGADGGPVRRGPVGGGEQAEPLRALETEGGQRRGDPGRRQRLAQHEPGQERRGRIGAPGEPATGRRRVLATQRGGGDGAEDLLEVLGDVAGFAQVRAEGRDLGGQDGRGGGRCVLRGGGGHGYDCAPARPEDSGEDVRRMRRPCGDAGGR